MKVTTDLTFNEMLKLPAFAGAEEFLLSNCYIPDMDISLAEMEKQQYDWVAESIAGGLNRMIELSEAGVPILQDIYTSEEKAADPEKAGTKLFYMPGKKGMPFVVVCPGGGYGAVCTLKEGFPVGKRLNELGYTVFVLSYRVRKMQRPVPGAEAPKREALLPKPMEDLATTLRMIRAKADEFGVDPENYAVAGFSSGGHLAGSWGTQHLGAPAYGLPLPKAIFLGYPASDTTCYKDFGMGKFGRNPLLTGMIGSDYTEDDVVKYNVNHWITPDYPATYVWHCADDPIISVETSRIMDRELTKAGVLHVYREAEKGGHGFGMGEKNAEINGWVDEAALLFEESLKAPHVTEIAEIVEEKGASRIVTHGRCRYVPEQQILYFNWTLAGFEIVYEGSVLQAKIRVLPDQMPGTPNQPCPPPDFPFIGRIKNGEVAERFGLRGGEQWVTLHKAEQWGTHRVEIVKLSENERGKCGVLAFASDGELRPAASAEQSSKGDQAEKPLKIEFLGDSITCGFGNEAKDLSVFRTEDENGWAAYGAVCARELEAEASYVSVSGISVTCPEGNRYLSHFMDEIYEYTDLYMDEKLGLEAEKWDFAAHPQDVVVINLGTNDANIIKFESDWEKAEKGIVHFKEAYKRFLKRVRELNGPDTLIFCTLGSMEYFLYSDLKETVADYVEETGDPNVALYRIHGINLLTEGIGAVTHPSAKSDLRMGKEVACILRRELETRGRM